MKHPTERTDVTSRPRLTATDLTMLRLIANGATNQAIAHALGVSTSTTGRRLTALFEKLGAKDRTHATVVAMATELIKLREVKLPTWVHLELSATREPVPDGG